MHKSVRNCLTASLVLAGVLAVPAAAFAETTLLTFKNPTNGCTYKVWGPTATVSTLPNPGVKTAGGFGESVSCP